MSKITFRLADDESLIGVDCLLHDTKYILALDTGATHTVIDLAVMMIEGYELKDAIRTVKFETAKGEIQAYVFKVAKLNVLGKERKNLEICSYDFFDNQNFADVHGMLGLDFFKDTDLLISFKRFEISVS